MVNNNAHEMRKLVTLLDTPSLEHQLEEALAPILKQKMKSMGTGLLAKFSQRHKGMDLIQKALVPYMKLFSQVMGRKGQNWDTVTWRTVGNFITSTASLRLPMGEYAPQRINANELNKILTSAPHRQVVSQYLPSNIKSQINLYLPRSLTSANLDKPVSAMESPSSTSDSGSPVAEATGDKADIAQKIITGLFVAVIQKLFDKAEESGDFDTEAPPAPEPSPSPTPRPAKPSPAPTPASSIDMRQAIDTLRQVYGRLSPEEQTRLLDMIRQSPAESSYDLSKPILESLKDLLSDQR